MNRARLYEDFSSKGEFDAAEAYARDSGVLLFARREDEAHRCALAVSAEAHGEMKKYFRAWQARQAAAPGGQ